jgi:hypothetical protein
MKRAIQVPRRCQITAISVPYLDAAKDHVFTAFLLLNARSGGIF